MSARYIGVAEAAEYLSLTEDGIRWRVRTKEIPHIKKGRRLFFDKQELDRWMFEDRVEAS